MGVFDNNWIFWATNWVFFTKTWDLLAIVGQNWNFLPRIGFFGNNWVIFGNNWVFFDNDWLFLDKNWVFLARIGYFLPIIWYFLVWNGRYHFFKNRVFFTRIEYFLPKTFFGFKFQKLKLQKIQVCPLFTTFKLCPLDSALKITLQRCTVINNSKKKVWAFRFQKLKLQKKPKSVTSRS